MISAALPLRGCNCFIPGRFRLTGPKADFAPALDYAELVLRRAEEVGVQVVVLGSGWARNVPGDFTAFKTMPDIERGTAQFTEFCGLLCDRVKDLKTVTVVIEPLGPKWTNIVCYVWQAVQVCQDVNSPRLKVLADIFHMMAGREEPESIVKAAPYLRHCHVASYSTRRFPGAETNTVCRMKPYFDALRQVGYVGGVSCECLWGKDSNFEKSLETAIETLKGLI